MSQPEMRNLARDPSSRRRRRRHRPWGVLAAFLGLYVLVLMSAGAALATFRYLPAVDEARLLRVEIEAIGSGLQDAGMTIDAAGLNRLEQDVASARGRLDRLAGLLSTDPLVALARALPPTAADVRGADAIAAAAGDVFDAVEDALAIAGRYVEIQASQAADPEDASSLALLVELMATTAEPAASASASLDRAAATLGSIPAGLAGPIEDVRQAMTERIAAYAPILDAYLGVAADLPDILGWDEPRRYLVLTQNPSELRPTGGFIGSYGLVGFDKGRITERDFQDVYLLDNPVDYPHVDPPPKLAEHILRPSMSWSLRDANWSPDFPTSAQDALRLYVNQSGDTTVDGVVGITTHTIDELLRITGPITVPDYDVTLAPGETTLKVLELTRTSDDPDENRKAFLSAMADQLFETLLTLPPDRWTEVLGTATSLQEERLVLAWFSTPAHQRLATDNELDGAVRSDAGDYLYPVDANVRPFSKLNAMTTRTLDLDVRLDASGNARNTLEISWNNRILTPEGAPYRALPGVGPLRDLGMYFRMLVPSGSQLQSVSGGNPEPLTAPEVIEEEAGRTSISNYLEIPPGSSGLRYAWISPQAAVDGSYRLTIQKQPGLLPGPITVTIHVPDGHRITDAGEGLIVSESGQTAHLETTFDQDIVLTVSHAP